MSSRPAGPPRIAVVGAGVAGLAMTFELLERAERVPGGVELQCFEAAPRAGGKVETISRDGYLCECGATGFLDNVPATFTLIRRLGLEERLVKQADEASKRFIFRAGKLRPLPLKPPELFRSGLLSWPGILRLLAEPWIRPARDDVDESVFEFARRRFGREAAAVLAQALVTGIYGGDAEQLSIAATFPEVPAMEREHGSLFKAMSVRRRKAKESGEKPSRPALWSFRGGLIELVDRLAERLGPALQLDAPVQSISDMGTRGFRVHGREGAPRDVDAVVLAAPGPGAARLLEHTDERLAEEVGAVPTVPITVVHLGFRDAQTVGRPHGFGFLVPREQGLRILGTSWISDVFPGRAPQGMTLMTTMVGGAHDPQARELDDRELLHLVREDLRRAMGIEAEPVFSEIVRHARAIPQYVIGHDRRLGRIDARLAEHPGLFLTGWGYRGVAINACIAEAGRLADQVLEAATAHAGSERVSR